MSTQTTTTVPDILRAQPHEPRDPIGVRIDRDLIDAADQQRASLVRGEHPEMVVTAALAHAREDRAPERSPERPGQRPRRYLDHGR